MVELGLRSIDPATFGLDEGNIFKGACVPHHQHSLMLEEVSLIDMFYLYVGNFSWDDLCEESQSFSE